MLVLLLIPNLNILTYTFRIFFLTSTSFSTMRSSNCCNLKSFLLSGVLHSGQAADGLVNITSTQLSHLKKKINNEVRLFSQLQVDKFDHGCCKSTKLTFRSFTLCCSDKDLKLKMPTLCFPDSDDQTYQH